MEYETFESEMEAAQTADIAAAWVEGARIATYQPDTSKDVYEEVVMSRGGVVLDHYTLTLDENGETKTDFHRLKSLKGRKISADNGLPSGFGDPVRGRYNTLTREFQVK